MGIIVDILSVLFILLVGYLGIKKGLLTKAISVLVHIAIIIISFVLKTKIFGALVLKLPFLGLSGLTSLNILIYNLFIFIILLVVLDCVFNILIKVTGFTEMLNQEVVLPAKVSKIGGAILGAIEGWIYVLLVLFILAQANITSGLVGSSKVGMFIVDRTFIVSPLLGGQAHAGLSIYETIKDSEAKGADLQTMNRDVLVKEVGFRLITPTKANELIDMDKLDLGDFKLGEIVNG